MKFAEWPDDPPRRAPDPYVILRARPSGAYVRPDGREVRGRARDTET